MYSATEKETIKVMKKIDMTIPRTIKTLASTLRTANEKEIRKNHSGDRYWFNEEIILSALGKLNAEQMTVGVSNNPYYYIDN